MFRRKRKKPYAYQEQRQEKQRRVWRNTTPARERLVEWRKRENDHANGEPKSKSDWNGEYGGNIFDWQR